MTPEDQIEFQNQMTRSRYQLIQKCDEKLNKTLDSILAYNNRKDEMELAEVLVKLAGVRVHLFREFLEMATLAGVSRNVNTLPSDYGNWLSMVDKGADDEQHEEEKQ